MPDQNSLQKLYATALQLHRSGHQDQARMVLQQAMKLAPGVPQFEMLAGVVEKALGKLEAAKQHLTAAINGQPDVADFHCHLGDVLAEQQNAARAETAYRQALELDPAYFEAANNLGRLLRQEGRAEEACVAYRTALEINPNDAEVLNNYGCALEEQGEATAAITTLNRALSIRPDFANALVNLARIEAAFGRHDSAIYHSEQAIGLVPNHWQYHNNFSGVLIAAGRFEQALGEAETAITLNPNEGGPRVNSAVALLRLRRMDDAQAAARTAVERSNGKAPVLSLLGTILDEMGQYDEAEVMLRKAVASAPDSATIHSNLVWALGNNVNTSLAQFVDELRAWDRAHTNSVAPLTNHVPQARAGNQKIKVGYITADLTHHSLSYAVEPLFTQFNSERFDVFCYASVRNPDDRTAFFKSLPLNWRDVLGWTDKAVAELILADKVDILVDLSGHTEGNRMMAFAHRPAPVQVSWMNISGFAAIDHVLTDREMIDGDRFDHLHETPYCLPGGIFHYTPPANSPDVSRAPGSRTIPTFGYLGSIKKISQDCLDLWARVLLAVDGAHLILKGYGFDDPAICTKMAAAFAQRGVDKERIKFIGKTSRIDHLRAHAQVDVVLDSFPSGGGVTTFEALWLGVPVISHKPRPTKTATSASILAALGLKDWVCQTEDQFINRAAELVTNAEALDRWRAQLRPMIKLANAPNGERYIREIEQAYEQFWRQWVTP